MSAFPVPCDSADAVHAAVYPLVSFARQPRYEVHASLASDLALDAIDLVSAACALDEALGIELPDAAIEGWVTVADVVASVEQARWQPLAHRFAEIRLPPPVFAARQAAALRAETRLYVPRENAPLLPNRTD